MKKNEEFIQLPPMKKSVNGNVVMMIWEFMQLSEEGKKAVSEQIRKINEEDTVEPIEIPEEYREILKSEIEGYEKAFQQTYANIIQESSKLACWVYDHKYNRGWSLEKMIHAYPSAELFIIAMSMNFDLIMEEDTDIDDHLQM